MNRTRIEEWVFAPRQTVPQMVFQYMDDGLGVQLLTMQWSPAEGRYRNQKDYEFSHRISIGSRGGKSPGGSRFIGNIAPIFEFI